MWFGFSLMAATGSVRTTPTGGMCFSGRIAGRFGVPGTGEAAGLRFWVSACLRTHVEWRSWYGMGKPGFDVVGQVRRWVPAE